MVFIFQQNVFSLYDFWKNYQSVFHYKHLFPDRDNNSGAVHRVYIEVLRYSVFEDSLWMVALTAAFNHLSACNPSLGFFVDDSRVL